MKKIDLYMQLQEEKRLTKQRIQRLELLIEQDVAEIKSSLDPWKAVGHTMKNMVSSEKDGVGSESISLTIDALIRRLLLRKSNWVFKLLIPFFLKNYAKNFLSKNAENILGWLIMKIRPKGGNHLKEYYDQSASEIDWER